jgi:RNA polymerase sigma-70 factor (ECF subfamily)
VALVLENEFQTLAAGDRIACELFVRDEYEGLFRWFLWLTNCPHRAADLTQETFTAFWGSLTRTTPDTSPRTWLFAIGRNQWRKDCRDRKSHAGNGDRSFLADASGSDDETGDDLFDQISDSGPSPEEIAEHREFAAALEAEVATLPPDLREVLVLRLWQEFDYDDIAAVQGIKPELARWRFFRARQILRARLKAFCLQEDDHGK